MARPPSAFGGTIDSVATAVGFIYDFLADGTVSGSTAPPEQGPLLGLDDGTERILDGPEPVLSDAIDTEGVEL